MKLSEETINKLQRNTANIRNICILAHVDHGKTSLSDSLLATNGIISQRMAGKVRYLDSREDEQLRGITMEASAISLYFKVMRMKEGTEEVELNEYLINLIDSPGHIDFSSEVSTASRLCDGAVVLVDVVEGVCSQTVNVLRQCWVDKLKPLLVINKIDRLISDWKLTPLEAYQHISRVIEQINSVLGSFYVGERMEDDMIWRESGSKGEFIEKDDQGIYFAPELNNVIFASAVDGWAFNINTFAKLYLKKLGFSQNVLLKTLWGEFYLDMKNKKIIPGNKLKSNQSSLKPLFVSLILEQIWAVYENCVINRDQDKLEKIMKKLDTKVSPRDINSKDHKNLLNLIMSQWIPISHAVLGPVIDYIPSPKLAQKDRMEKILDECMFGAVEHNLKSELIDEDFYDSICTCDSSDPTDKTLAYVSKLISVPAEDLPKESDSANELTADEIKERGRIARELARKASEAAAAAAAASSANDNTEGDDFVLPTPKADPFEWEFEEEEFEEEEDIETIPETLIAFTRIYSGSLSVGQTVTVIGPKYDPTLGNNHPDNVQQITHEVKIKDLYLIMGREFVKMNTVPAGNIVGVVGLSDCVLKNATICSKERDGPYINLSATTTLIHNKPIMRVAIEPTNPMKLDKLEKGLDLLSKADPVLDWYIDDESGELIMCVAGELHLERCLKDLEERFAKSCNVTIKEPVIPFREGLGSLDADEVDRDISDVVFTDGYDFEFEFLNIPSSTIKFLTSHEQEINELLSSKKNSSYDKESILIFKDRLIESFNDAGFKSNFFSSVELVERIVAFGPRRVGANIFVESKASGDKFPHIFGKVNEDTFEYATSVINGFQLATSEGPLAAEPMQGLIVVIKNVSLDASNNVDNLTNISGKLITQTRDLIHNEFLRRSPRLFLAMYTCDIQASTEVLGKVYAVVQKRGGFIISEEMKEGTPFFTIEAKIPVVEAFGFSEEIRNKTSGAASPQLLFDGFDMLDINPFWVPHTEEELEELGEFAERENIARRYMNTIRRRKGLFVDEKVVKNAEKQRTLKKD